MSDLAARTRLDHVLVERGLAPSRSKAQQLIDAGEVEVLVRAAWKTIKQPSYPVGDKLVRLREGAETLRYVSRGGLKLEGALEKLGLDVTGFRCMDLGISTGGFTDCLLQRGAREVCGVDVGHGQLHANLSSDSRVLAFEGVNVKDLSGHVGVGDWMYRVERSDSGAQLAAKDAYEKMHVDLCVADLSFISLISLFPSLPPIPRFLGLIKPQFEVGAGNLDKTGIVRDAKLFAEVELRAHEELTRSGYEVKSYFPSRVKGQDGNQEFFIYGLR